MKTMTAVALLLVLVGAAPRAAGETLSSRPMDVTHAVGQPSLVPSRAAAQPATRSPIFRFETGEFWLNLHHFLYVLGRAEAKTTDASREAVVGAPDDAAKGLALLTDEERRAWRAAVAYYASGPGRKDLVFDEPSSALTRALVSARDAASLSSVTLDAPTVAVLERVAPIYRKAWWPAHHVANRAWQSAVQALVDRHGAAILAFITKAYGLAWPADGFPVHVSAWANWAGAYSTHETLVVSSLAVGNAGASGLETVFHEGMHPWDSEVFGLLRTHARQIDRLVPAFLSHALIFYTAGEAVRREVPGYTPYADAFGVWARGATTFKAALEETWRPYLDGRGTRDEALAALVGKTATEPRR
jgi:hypothetical protein